MKVLTETSDTTEMRANREHTKSTSATSVTGNERLRQTLHNQQITWKHMVLPWDLDSSPGHIGNQQQLLCPNAGVQTHSSVLTLQQTTPKEKQVLCEHATQGTEAKGQSPWTCAGTRGREHREEKKETIVNKMYVNIWVVNTYSINRISIFSATND